MLVTFISTTKPGYYALSTGKELRLAQCSSALIPPLLLDYRIEMLMKLPGNFKALDEATKDTLSLS